MFLGYRVHINIEGILWKNSEIVDKVISQCYIM